MGSNASRTLDRSRRLAPSSAANAVRRKKLLVEGSPNCSGQGKHSAGEIDLRRFDDVQAVRGQGRGDTRDDARPGRSERAMRERRTDRATIGKSGRTLARLQRTTWKQP